MVVAVPVGSTDNATEAPAGTKHRVRHVRRILDAILKDIESNTPCVDDPHERGIVLVPKVGREGLGREDVAVDYAPAPPVRLPLDASREVFDQS